MQTRKTSATSPAPLTGWRKVVSDRAERRVFEPARDENGRIIVRSAKK